jgi:phosphatidylserine/phosphatidylglycerophosphate/cardiolipin synthase-like enzyme
MSKTINNVIGDIYIGKGSGKMIIEDLLAARKSIRIMSPYLSAKLVDVLMDRFKSGIAVELVTSDEIEDHKQPENKNCYRIIRQHKHVDERLKSRKAVLQGLGLILMLFFGLATGMKLPLMFAPSVRGLDYVQFAVLAGIALFGRYIWTQGKRLRFWYYSYSSLFPIKIFYSYFSRRKTDRSKAFNLHSKLYIIDDCIAYLGSVNFTRSGCLLNHETRIRITDPEAIYQLKQEFEELLEDEYYNHRSVDEWGRELYETERE